MSHSDSVWCRQQQRAPWSPDYWLREGWLQWVQRPSPPDGQFVCYVGAPSSHSHHTGSGRHSSYCNWSIARQLCPSGTQHSWCVLWQKKTSQQSTRILVTQEGKSKTFFSVSSPTQASVSSHHTMPLVPVIDSTNTSPFTFSRTALERRPSFTTNRINTRGP